MHIGWCVFDVVLLLLLLFVSVFNSISSPFIDSYLSYFSPASQFFDVGFSSSFIRCTFRIVCSLVRVESFVWLLLNDDNVNFFRFSLSFLRSLRIYFALVKFKNVISNRFIVLLLLCFVSLCFFCKIVFRCCVSKFFSSSTLRLVAFFTLYLEDHYTVSLLYSQSDLTSVFVSFVKFRLFLSHPLPSKYTQKMHKFHVGLLSLCVLRERERVFLLLLLN